MKLSFLFGTRPEVIKLAPLILEARRRGHEAQIVLTGQHRHLCVPLLDFFGLRPDLELDVMSHNQTLPSLSMKVLERLEENKARLKSDVILTQGDTTSAFISSYWAFCSGIPVGHVEAGLRTLNIRNPFPEEANRQLIGRIADFHFTPTEAATKALKREGVYGKHVYQVGNTSIDALKFTLAKLKTLDEDELLEPRLLDRISGKKLILVTAHRRESFGAPLRGICQGILRLVESDPRLCAVYPVHPNPNVRQETEKLLRSHLQVALIEPQAYLPFVSLMKRADLILTDSGGVQEEAPTLRKPILVMRETSERPEGIRRGFAKLVGTDPNKIYREGLLALKRGCQGKGSNPYGDGKASFRIVRALEKALK